MQLRRCVILGTPSESFWLQIIIEKYFKAIFIMQTYHDAMSLSPAQETSLLLATDAFPGGLNEQLITTIKKNLSPMLRYAYSSRSPRKRKSVCVPPG
jgi:hypothetical protein